MAYKGSPPAAKKNSGAPLDLTAREYRTLLLRGEGTVDSHWWKPLPNRVRSMLMTDDVLYVAGPQGNPMLLTPMYTFRDVRTFNRGVGINNDNRRT